MDYKLSTGELSKFPVVLCRNAYILPGVPYLLRQKWAAIRGFLTGKFRVKPFLNRTVRINLGDETRIAGTLAEVALAFGNEVTIGSYPVTNQEDGAMILVTLDGKLPGPLEEAAELLCQKLPQGSIIEVEENVRSLLRAQSSVMLT